MWIFTTDGFYSAVQRIDHPQLGEIVVPHSPLRFRGTDPVPLIPSPALGADNDEVFSFAWLHYAVLGVDLTF